MINLLFLLLPVLFFIPVQQIIVPWRLISRQYKGDYFYSEAAHSLNLGQLEALLVRWWKWRRNGIFRLPPEIQIEIFKQLEYKDLLNIQFVKSFSLAKLPF